MISLHELQTKSLRLYEKVLRAHLAGENLFPLKLPANKNLDRTQGIDQIYAQQAALLLRSKNKTGHGYTLTLKPNPKTKQSEISRISFETRDDFLHFIAKGDEFAGFARTAELAQEALPELLPLLCQQPRLLLLPAATWEQLLQVCQYFQQHPQPNQYVRNLPLALPTKFIERHQATLRVLLDYLLPTYVRSEEKDFFRRFHLHAEEPSIKIRFLEERLRLHPAISHISVWVSEFEQLRLAGNRVYIIENLTTFLSFPAVPDGLAIWGGGFAVQLLAATDWLREKNLFYWGDIDVHGFQILSQIRTHFPAIQSLLMDAATYTQFAHGDVGGIFTSHSLSNLTAPEQTIYQSLLRTNGRLEQERISPPYVDTAIAATLFP